MKRNHIHNATIKSSTGQDVQLTRKLARSMMRAAAAKAAKKEAKK